MRRFIGVVMLALMLVVAGAAQSMAERPLRVVVAGEAPFVEETAAGLDGLSVRVWANVASQAGLAFKMQRVSTIQSAVDEVAQGKADIAVGPITITARRAKVVSFTLPYYTTTLGIATPPQADTMWGRLRPLVAGFLIFLVGVVVLLFVVGNAIWFVERHRNSETFPRAWLTGVGNGMWLAVVTMTGVGYGDTVPITGWGRLVAAAWMLVTMLFASTLTASIASMMTEYRLTNGAIDTPGELAGRRVAVVGGSAVVDYANQCHALVIQAKDVAAAADLVFSAKADAVLYHVPELRYYMQHHPEHAMLLAPLHEVRNYFGFVAPFGSPLVSKLNVSLLQLHESGEIHRIEATWVGDSGGDEGSPGAPVPSTSAAP